MVPERFRREFDAAVEAAGLTPEQARVFAALVSVESAWNPTARNPASTARGLTQVLKSTAENPGFGIEPVRWEDLDDPQTALTFGAKYFQAMLRARGGDLEEALRAYYAGPGATPTSRNLALQAAWLEGGDYARKVLSRAGLGQLSMGATEATQAAPQRDPTAIFRPALPLTDPQRIAIEQAERERDPGLLRTIQNAFELEQSIMWAFRASSGIAPDPEWRMTEEEWKNLTKDIPQHYWSAFDRAHSAEHAAALREDILRMVELEKDLAAAGWVGLAARLAAAFLDVVAIATGTAVGMAATPAANVLAHAKRVGEVAQAARRASRGGLIASGAAVGGIAGVAEEIAVQSMSPLDTQWDQVAVAGLAGASIASLVVAARTRNRSIREAALDLHDLANQSLRRTEQEARATISPRETPPQAEPGTIQPIPDTPPPPPPEPPAPQAAARDAVERLKESVWQRYSQPTDADSLDPLVSFLMRENERGLRDGLGPLTREEAFKVLDQVIAPRMRRLKQAEDAPTKARPEAQSAGAAASPVTGETIGNPWEGLGDVPQTAMRYGRMDLFAYLGGHDNDAARAIGRALLADPVGPSAHSRDAFGYRIEDPSGNVPSIPAELEARRWYDSFMTQWRQVESVQFREWARDQGYGFAGRWFHMTSLRREFGRQVAQFIRTTDPTVESLFPAPVRRAGEEARRILAKLAQMQNNPGMGQPGNWRPVAGFGTLPPDKYYLPRRLKQRALLEAIQTVGEKGLYRFFAGAFKAAKPDLADDAAYVMARAYVRAHRKYGWGMDADIATAFGDENLEFLRKVLRDADVPESDIELVMRRIKEQEEKKAKDAGKPPSGRRRADLDENFEMDVPTIDGDDFIRLRMADLLEDDLEYLLGTYTRQAVGRVALARVKIRNELYDPDNPKSGPEFLVDGITSDTDIERIFDAIRAREERDIREGRRKYRTWTEADERRLRYVFNWIAGRARDEQRTELAQVARMIKDYNVLRLMGQLGFAQAAETLNIVTSVGVRAALAGMPAFRRMITKDGRKVFTDDLAREIEAVWGFGAERLRSFSPARLTEDNVWGQMRDLRSPMGRLLVGTDNFLHYSKQVLGDVSGMNAVNGLLMRWAAQATVQKFAQVAFNRSAANLKRIRALGIDTTPGGMLDRIREQIKEHGTFERGFFTDVKMRRLNLDEWTDQEARAAFETAVYAWVRRQVMQNDLGNLPMWVSHPVGQLLIQFRTFMLGAYSKVLLHNLYMADMTALATFFGQILSAGMAYVIQQLAAASARPDAEEYLFGERGSLSPERLIAAAVSRSAWASVVPMAVDTFTAATTNRMIFDARTSGLPGDVIWGNPFVDLQDSIRLGLGAIGSSIIDDRPLSQTELRRIRSTLLFANTIPVIVLSELMMSDQPPKPPRKH